MLLSKNAGDQVALRVPVDENVFRGRHQAVLDAAVAGNGFLVCASMEKADIEVFPAAADGAEECFEPILSIIPLQLLAYHIAIDKGRNVDQPRNLAKSVTVE